MSNGEGKSQKGRFAGSETVEYLEEGQLPPDRNPKKEKDDPREDKPGATPATPATPGGPGQPATPATPATPPPKKAKEPPPEPTQLPT